MKYIVSYSGGIGSWAATNRLLERGIDRADIALLFADTGIEDEDLYRFLDETSTSFGIPLTVVRDGRGPWEVFRDERILTSRYDPCSKHLKRKLLDQWCDEHADPETAIRVIGIDIWEQHRLESFRERVAPWKVAAPLCERPYISKPAMFELLESKGILAPRLYDLGFHHNNCGGFCIKAGQAQFALLLKTMPERYAMHEEEEQRLRVELGDDAAVLRDRKGGETKPLTLREFRERVEAGDKNDQMRFDWGGCGCAIE